jgi:hypothetical protein
MDVRMAIMDGVEAPRIIYKRLPAERQYTRDWKVLIFCRVGKSGPGARITAFAAVYRLILSFHDSIHFFEIQP